MAEIYLGYDPGGDGALGVAAINGEQALCATVATAQDAINWLTQQCGQQTPAALGLDTLTLWSTGPAGWRPADRALRQAYPVVSNSIVAPNSLYGAMCINGAAAGLTLRQQFPAMLITETHPKVLYSAFTGDVYDFTGNHDGMTQQLAGWLQLAVPAIPTDHAWDALISAYAARAWHTKEWTTDLHQLPANPHESLVWPMGPAAYAWPTAISPAGDAPMPARGIAPKRPRWQVAVDVLHASGHHEVAQQVQKYRNAKNERAGWDAWLKARFPELWNLVSQHE